MAQRCCALVEASRSPLARRRRTREARDDAWWTGPLLAPSAATLPPGHVLIEPYLFDDISNGHFDSGGERHSGPYEHDLGSLTYMLYGRHRPPHGGSAAALRVQRAGGRPQQLGRRLSAT